MYGVGRADEVREVPLVGPRGRKRRPDAAGEVVQPLGQVLLGAHVRCVPDDPFGGDDRLGELLSDHASTLERVLGLREPCRTRVRDDTHNQQRD